MLAPNPVDPRDLARHALLSRVELAAHESLQQRLEISQREIERLDAELLSTQRQLFVASVLIWLSQFLFLIWLLWAAPAAAQGYRADGLPDFATMLARTCIAEAGWDSMDSGECAAIFEVARARARVIGCSTDRALSLYASEHFSPERERRLWVLGLLADGERPPHWPPQLDWNRYRSRWLDTIEHTRKIAMGDVRVPCTMYVDHWGGAMDDHRALAAGWFRVYCPSMRNHFWCIAPCRARTWWLE